MAGQGVMRPLTATAVQGEPLWLFLSLTRLRHITKIP